MSFRTERRDNVLRELDPLRADMRADRGDQRARRPRRSRKRVMLRPAWIAPPGFCTGDCAILR